MGVERELELLKEVQEAMDRFHIETVYFRERKSKLSRKRLIKFSNIVSVKLSAWREVSGKDAELFSAMRNIMTHIESRIMEKVK